MLQRDNKCSSELYRHGSVQRSSILTRSNKMQHYAGIYLLHNVAKFGHVGGRSLLRYCDLYQRVQLQFYVLLMMGAMDTRNM